MPIRKVSAEKFIARSCRESYYLFLLEFWPLISAERLHDNWHIKKLCDELQVMAERVFRDQPKAYDLVANCPPGTTKSSIFSVLFQAWVWTRMPSARFITGSYSEKLALDLSRKTRDVVLSEKYQRLFPEIKLREDQNTKSYFANTFGGMRWATGVGGTVTGVHAHFIIIDDPINPLDVLSDLLIQEARIWINETLSDRKVDKSLTPTIMVMQRLHQADPTGDWLERAEANAAFKNRLKHICLPAELTDDVKPESWKEHYVDGLLDPVRLSRQVLEDAAERGESYYAGQYLQTPVPRGGAMFKVDRILYYSQAPKRFKKGPVRYWDKAATKDGGAWTAGVKMALDFDDRIWILDVVRGQWDSWTREHMIQRAAVGDGKETRIGMEQEPGSGGKESAEASARRLAKLGFRVSLDAVKGDKEVRADGFSVEVNCGGVNMVLAPWNRVYVEELKFFPFSRYKDMTDASSGAYGLLTKKRMKIGGMATARRDV